MIWFGNCLRIGKIFEKYIRLVRSHIYFIIYINFVIDPTKIMTKPAPVRNGRTFFPEVNYISTENSPTFSSIIQAYQTLKQT